MPSRQASVHIQGWWLLAISYHYIITFTQIQIILVSLYLISCGKSLHLKVLYSAMTYMNYEVYVFLVGHMTCSFFHCTIFITFWQTLQAMNLFAYERDRFLLDSYKSGTLHRTALQYAMGDFKCGVNISVCFYKHCVAMAIFSNTSINTKLGITQWVIGNGRFQIRCKHLVFVLIDIVRQWTFPLTPALTPNFESTSE